MHLIRRARLHRGLRALRLGSRLGSRGMASSSPLPALARIRDLETPVSAVRVSACDDASLFRRISVAPVTASLGAEVHGVDLASPDLSEDTVEEIRSAFLMFGVIFFRGQSLDPPAQVRLARRFGELDRHPIVKGMPEYPDVLEIVREAGAATNFGETWHSDNSYMSNPSLGSILHAIEVPPVGNDTLFSCSYGAYEGLSPALRSALDGMGAIHTAGVAFSPDTVSGGSFDDDTNAAMKYQKSDELVTDNIHPVVRTHPETGRRGLYVNSMFTTRFEGMTEEESTPLLSMLFGVVSQPHLQCRFRWSQGDVAMWDNRAVQHVAIGDNSSHRRVMRRVTLEGDRPFFKSG